MSDHNPSCPACASTIPTRSVVFEFQLECPYCRSQLRVPLVYQANFTLGSLVLGLVAACVLNVGSHFVEALFLFAFVFALFLATTVVPLLPPTLEVRQSA